MILLSFDFRRTLQFYCKIISEHFLTIVFPNINSNYNDGERCELLLRPQLYIYTRYIDELTKEQIELLRNAFNAFDPEKNGYINTAMVGTILSMLGHQLDDATLADIIAEVDEDGSGQIEFEEFTTLAARFLVEEDAEAMMQELKEAFRLYDKEGNGYITTGVLREILRELDDKLTNDDLDMMIEEIDSDGSGTVDFDEFMEVMTGGDD
ncbi:troponin C isoform X1 [Drosophila pseudoobscura]|uniref:Troponin C isoform X1 n=3 Tax=Drosophila pseudoobscura TaxID=7237 RepID=A0A6I8VVZ5_DROPS|nr:troponin C isoform X1 [Drosophila pseudoobscura]